MGGLAGKVALVTGASRGIGRGIALALAGAGATVAVNYVGSEREARDVVEEIQKIGSRAIPVRADVAQVEQLEYLLDTTTRMLGPVDILVSNHGIARPVTLETLHLATWDATFAVNLRAPYVLSAAVIPGMRARRWGRLLYISSTAARVGGIVGPHYAASKSGLEGLMRSYASLLAKEGITSNALAPALIETEMLAGNPAATPDRVPVGRFGSVEEVASMAVAVVTNPYITGQTMQVNGGIYMT